VNDREGRFGASSEAVESTRSLTSKTPWRQATDGCRRSRAHAAGSGQRTDRTDAPAAAHFGAGQASVGSQTGFPREPGEQRAVSVCLEGEQSPWKYRVCVRWKRRSTLRTRRWSNALESIGARHDTQASVWSVEEHEALTAGPNATGTRLLRRCPVERHRCREGVEPGNRLRTLGPDRIRCASAHGTATRTSVREVAESLLSERHSPSNDRSGNRSGCSGNSAVTQGQP